MYLSVQVVDVGWPVGAACNLLAAKPVGGQPCSGAYIHLEQMRGSRSALVALAPFAGEGEPVDLIQRILSWKEVYRA